MDRRQFLVGVFAVGATLSSTVKASMLVEPAKVPLSESAIFSLMPTQYPDGRPLEFDPSVDPYLEYRIHDRSKEILDVAKRWTTQPDPNNISQIQFTIKSYTSEDKTGVVFDCAKDIDQYFIMNSEMHKNASYWEGLPSFSHKLFRSEMGRACNSIAKQTRRGAGNHIILHPDRANEARRLGYDSHIPFQNIIERDWMARDEAFVFYKGTHWDEPGILFHNGNLVLPDGFSYGRRVKFKV